MLYNEYIAPHRVESDCATHIAQFIAKQMPHDPHHYDSRSLTSASVAERWAQAAIRNVKVMVPHSDITATVKMYLRNMALAELEGEI